MRIVLAGDEEVAGPLCVAAWSARQWAEHHVPISVLDCGLSADTLRTLDALVGGSVETIEVDLQSLAGLPIAALAPATWARCLIPELVHDTDRILYLDADVLVRAPLSPLLEMDLAGRAAAAAPFPGNVLMGEEGDRWVPGWRERKLPATAAIFNAGILIMDLTAWRAEDISRRAFDLSRRRPDYAMPSADQSILNLVMWDRWLPLASKWNTRFLPANILHFYGPRKPWLADAAKTWERALYVNAAAAVKWDLGNVTAARFGARGRALARGLLPPYITRLIREGLR